MNPDTPLAVLGGLSPAAFAARHWQRRPILVRGALPGVQPPASRAALFALASRQEVESRIVERQDADRWRLRHGPFTRRQLPPLARPGWTLLVQGVDLHLPAAHALLSQFRFVSDARLDDLMISFATDGGGVGAHLDSYDVFLVQVAGRRRWRVGPVRRPSWQPDQPLKLLREFTPTDDWVLGPGDLLYVPPGWGHDGVAVGECMTASVGFRAPRRAELVRELLPRLADAAADDDALYRDPPRPATATPGRVPPAMRQFARQAVRQALAEPGALDRALGEFLTEPKPQVWFDAVPGDADTAAGVVLDPRSRMLYDRDHVYLNGEAFRAAGRDAALIRRLADRRALNADGCRQLSPPARALLRDWLAQGWLRRG